MINHLVRGTLFLAGLLVYSVTVLAAPVTIDFEAFSDSQSLTNQIAGVTFRNATVLSAGISLNELDFPPHSGSNVIVDDGSPLSISFGAPVLSIQGFFTYTIDVLMRAFDAGGNVVASATSLFGSNLTDIGDPGSSPNELISVAFASGISRVEIQGDTAGLSFVMDDLTYRAARPGGGTAPEPGTLTLLLIAAFALIKYVRPATTINRTASQRVPVKHFSPMSALGLVLLLVAKMSNAQSIPAVSVSPTSATAGAATTVTATVAITDARLTSVNLIKIDSTGRSTNLGPMHDDGLNGDVSSNDRIFTLRFTVLEASPTTISYKASAAFRGVLRRSQSSLTQFIVAIAPPSLATRIAVGGNHSCAVTSTGGAKCWGSNTRGALGNGSLTDSTIPVPVSGLTSGVGAVSSGNGHTCALTTVGGAKCWGLNDFGQLGNGTTVDSTAPVDVIGLSSGVRSISSGSQFTCAITAAGGVKCWGSNFFGQLGNATSSPSPVPVDVIGLPAGINAISTGSNHACALTLVGGVKCWGFNGSGQPTQFNGAGQLGNGTAINSATAVDVFGLTTGVSAISAGSNHTCALTTLGGIKCWGRSREGQVGSGLSGDGANVLAPVDVGSLTSGVAAISAGGFHTCALTTPGGLKCWGDSTWGQIGNGSSSKSLTPMDVTGLTSGVAAVSAGGIHTCALTITGSMLCWGGNLSGQLGDGTRLDSEIPVQVVDTVVLPQPLVPHRVATGGSHSCALTSVGGVKCWGNNFAGQLGDNTVTGSLTPVGVSGLAVGVKSLVVGSSFSCALTTTGGVKCWGINDAGQLGNGSRINSSTPMDVVGLTSGVAAISAGSQHSCALTTTGGVKCWGVPTTTAKSAMVA